MSELNRLELFEHMRLLEKGLGNEAFDDAIREVFASVHELLEPKEVASFVALVGGTSSPFARGYNRCLDDLAEMDLVTVIPPRKREV